MRFNGSPRGTLVASIAAGLLTAGLAVSTAGAEDASPVDAAPEQRSADARLNPDAAPPAPIGGVQSDQTRTLRVLRRSRRASDAVPLDAMVAAGATRFGRNPRLARRVDGPAGKGWVVPGDGVVCLVAETPDGGYASTCGETRTVAKEGLTLGVIAPSSASAMTLVPDGAVVTTTSDRGSDDVVQPDDAGIVTVDAETTQSVDVATDAGHAETPVYDQTDVESGAVG